MTKDRCVARVWGLEVGSGEVEVRGGKAEESKEERERVGVWGGREVLVCFYVDY